MLSLEMFDCKYDNENLKKNKTYFICKWLHILCEYNIVVVVAKIDNKNIGDSDRQYTRELASTCDLPLIERQHTASDINAHCRPLECSLKAL